MPALSRRIQTLEHAVGRPLFDRHHHGLKLTEAGRALQVQLAPILDELRGAIGRVGGPDASLRLHLNVLPLFAQQRLFPRLPDLRSEEHTSELQSLMRISYAVFCLKKQTNIVHIVITSTQQQYRHTLT